MGKIVRGEARGTLSAPSERTDPAAKSLLGHPARSRVAVTSSDWVHPTTTVRVHPTRVGEGAPDGKIYQTEG